MIEATVIPPGTGPSNGFDAFGKPASVMGPQMDVVDPGMGPSNGQPDILPS